MSPAEIHPTVIVMVETMLLWRNCITRELNVCTAMAIVKYALAQLPACIRTAKKT